MHQFITSQFLNESCVCAGIVLALRRFRRINVYNPLVIAESRPDKLLQKSKVLYVYTCKCKLAIFRW